MLDADADICRRAWVSCTSCDDGDACAPCRQGRNCPDHWCYLLAGAARWLFVQCTACHHRWWHDTGFGAGNRPADLDEVDSFPAHDRQPELLTRVLRRRRRSESSHGGGMNQGSRSIMRMVQPP